MLKDLKRSGLTHTDATLLRLEAVTAKQMQERFNGKVPARAGYIIQYFDEHGKPTRFFRGCYTDRRPADGFSGQTKDKKKIVRYRQLANSVNEVYLPPYKFGPDETWADVMKDQTIPILVTEGEKKAAAVSKRSKGHMPTIGLGGVWNFTAGSKIPLLPQLEGFNWEDRTVYIAFDSDAATNPNIQMAEAALAKELLARKAHPCIVRTPSLDPGSKTGVDDYLVALGWDDFYKDVLTRATEWEASAELFKLNDEVIYVHTPSMIVELATFETTTVKIFATEKYATRKFSMETSKGPKQVQAAPEWIKWEGRLTATEATYVPGLEDRFTGDGKLNMWKGWGCKPKPGDVTPWKKLMSALFKDDAASCKWFEQWLAYPLRYPGAKLFQTVMLWGDQGVGKSIIGETMGLIYGVNFISLTDQTIVGRFNEHKTKMQFIQGEEITGGEGKGKFKIASLIKDMITSPRVAVEGKFKPIYFIPNLVNYIFTSNSPAPIYLEKSDRRWFVQHFDTSKELTPDWFQNEYVDNWLSKDGASHLFDYFLHLDISDFNPHSPAPITQSKINMHELGLTDLDHWVRDYPLTTPPGRAMPLTLVTLNHMQQEFIKAHDPKNAPNQQSMTHSLLRAGYERLYDGKQPLTVGRYESVRLWIVPGAVEKVKAMSRGEIVALYKRQEAQERTRSFQKQV